MDDRTFGIGVVQKAAPEGKVDISKVTGTIPAWQDGMPQVTPVNYQALLAQYKSWTYICANKNANSFASVELKLFVTKQSANQKIWVKTKAINKEMKDYLMSLAHVKSLPCVRKAVEIVEVTEHPLLDLMFKVNPFMDRYELLFLSDIFLELTGNCYWYVVRNSFNVPVQIWLLSPDRVKIVPSQEKWISGYIYTCLDGRLIPFMPDEIVHFKFPNPMNQFYGWSPLQAMVSSIMINEQMDQYQINLTRNNAIPSMALVAPKDAMISEEQWKRILSRWNSTYGGVRNTGKTAWLESGFDIKQLAFPPKDMAYEKGRKWTMQEICAAYGVPMSKVTVESVNRANADAGNYQYLADTIKPRCSFFTERLNQDLVPMIDENLFFTFDNPVPGDKQFELEERKGNLGSYVTTVNEERKKMGLEEVEWGNIPLVGNGIAPLGSQPAQPMQLPGQSDPFPVVPEKKMLENDMAEELANIILFEVEKRRRAIG